MVRIAVVHDRPVPPWSARQLIIALENLGATALYIRPSDIASVFGDGTSRVVYSTTGTPFEIDGVLLRDLGFTTTIEMFLRRMNVFEHLELLGVPVVNSVRALVRARDKYLSLILLHNAGIPTPRTAVVESAHLAVRIAEEWKDVVIKPLIGSMGFGAIRATNSDVVYVVARTLQQLGQPIYIQQYIPKPNRDIRIFVVGEEVVAAYYRVQPNENMWKTNIAQGARAVPMEKIDQELEELAIRCLKVLGLHYAGVDIAEGPEGYVVLEVNASPNWRGLTMATGINPAYKIAKLILDLVKK